MPLPPCQNVDAGVACARLTDEFGNELAIAAYNAETAPCGATTASRHSKRRTPTCGPFSTGQPRNLSTAPIVSSVTTAT